MDTGRAHGHVDDRPVYGTTVIGDADLSRFFSGLLLRLMAAVFAVILASVGHGLNSVDGAKAANTIHQANETGAER